MLVNSPEFTGALSLLLKRDFAGHQALFDRISGQNACDPLSRAALILLARNKEDSELKLERSWDQSNSDVEAVKMRKLYPQLAAGMLAEILMTKKEEVGDDILDLKSARIQEQLISLIPYRDKPSTQNIFKHAMQLSRDATIPEQELFKAIGILSYCAARNPDKLLANLKNQGLKFPIGEQIKKMQEGIESPQEYLKVLLDRSSKSKIELSPEAKPPEVKKRASMKRVLQWL